MASIRQFAVSPNVALGKVFPQAYIFTPVTHRMNGYDALAEKNVTGTGKFANVRVSLSRVS